MTPGETHNKLAREFVVQVAGETYSREEMMVVIESTIFATMLILVKLYGETPGVASAFLESALQNATERFSAELNKSDA